MLFCGKCGRKLVKRRDSTDHNVERQMCEDTSCGWVFYNNPVPVVAAVVERVRRDGATSVFLVQGRGWPKHWFGLVTGFLEKGEKAATGAVREVKEELGLDVEMVQPLGVFDFLRYNQVILAYHVRLVNEADTVTLDQSELQDYKEVPIESVEVFPGPTGEALGEYLRRKGQKSRL